jgi:erythromycin esterase-like protein
MDLTEFRTVEPGGGYRDLMPLLDMIGDARVVGLGECTHGTREFHQLKHRIVEMLVRERSFNSVVLEANLAEVIRVNEYVLEGRGDPAELLPRHLYWGVSTEETADLLRWMWEFNTEGQRRVALAGCDMHLRPIDPAFADSVAERYAKVLEADQAHWLSGMGIQTWFPVEEARGRRVRFSGFIRTEDVTDHACIWLWAGDAEGKLAYDALEDRRPRGTTDWREYAIELDVPEGALHVSLGCFIAGNGRAWFDGLRISLDGEPWQDPVRIDLDLSSEELIGFWVDPRNRTTRDEEVSRSGFPSLRIEPAEPVPEFVTTDMECLGLAKQVQADLTERFTPREAGRVLRCARVIVQAHEMRTGGGDAARARSMAENVEWLVDRHRDDRVVFWAHNAHVARGAGDTGSFLTKSLGGDYVPIGFATGEGECLAMSPRWREGFVDHPLAAPPEESVERHLMSMGHPRMLLDLRTVSGIDPDWNWLLDRRPFRNVGASALPYEFFDQRITDDFSLLFWVRETSPASPLTKKG